MSNSSEQKKFVPFVSPESNMAEFTIKALVIGLVMSVILGAANAYLGLRAGMTIAATYPAAVIGMAILKVLKGTILEENFARTVGSIGESVAAGAIFTLPAFFIAGAIAIFLDKQRITKLMGANANPFLAYPVAAFSGGILTVCSCGVIPIFTGILQQGAGVGPAFTFLMASPRIERVEVFSGSILLVQAIINHRKAAVQIRVKQTGQDIR